jgi:ABC-type multidrug transport system ATPase subunit
MLQVSGLTKRYGDQTVLADVDFSLLSGEVMGLIGPNGAGKTTLLEGLAGLIPTDAGAVSWDGTPLPPERRKEFMFYLPDGLRPWPDQHVAHLLGLFAAIYRRTATYVGETVQAVGLAPVLRKRVLALSKGYARRLMWALGMLAPHPVLLMDEPFDGFDLVQTREMTQRLRLMVAAGRTLIVSIHQLADAERTCDRFILLSDGRVRGTGTLVALRARAGCRGGLEEIFLALT